MLEVFLVLLVIAAVLAFIYMKWIRYRAVGQTEGVCVEVKTECEASNGSPYNRQLRGRDSRMYRPYIRYSWEGREYVARSVAAYGRAKIFPGDRVRVLVNDEDRELVKVI